MTALFQLLVTIVLFFGILGIAVVLHELGHFIVARLARVRVLEFGIGFPPRAKVLSDRGETIYTLNWLPIGGFVKLEGEDGTDPDDPRSFAAQGLPIKVLILLAGVAMNLLLAFAIFAAIALTGDPAMGVQVNRVQAGSPAEQAGIVAGDTIERLNGRAYSAFGSTGILEQLRADAGQTVTLHLRRTDGSTADPSVKLRAPAELSTTVGALGVEQLRLSPTQDRITYPPATALRLGWTRTIDATQLIVGGVGQLVSDLVTKPTEPPAAAGPIGIAGEIGEVFWTLGPIFTLYLAALLSANLAVVNVLPLPPLDGGRILVLVLKKVVGTRLSLRIERLTYVVGFALLFGFLIWVSAFDIARLGGPR